MKYFETRTRDGRDDITCLADGCPEWVRDVVYNIHGGMFPNDWLYRSASDAFDFYAMCQDNDESEDTCEQAQAFAEDHTEIYTNRLLTWLADFSGEFDEHVEEMGYGDNLASTIMAAQHGVLTNIYIAVANAIENNASEGDEA